MKMKKIFLFCFVLFSLSSCAQQRFKLNLSEIAKIQDDRPCQIIVHEGYTIGYNTQWCIPNWVAYEITSKEAQGQVPRKGHDFFTTDPMAQGPVVSYYDYSGSGYDRGHMAPAGDMKWSVKAMEESFYMSNMCPQNGNLNGGDWRILEEKVRTWAIQYGSLYVVCGPIVSDTSATIADGKIVVPDSFYKVIIRKTKEGAEAIGFIYKNEAGHHPMSSCAMSVDSVERVTNIDFFSTLSDNVETKAEGTATLHSWGITEK